MKLKAGQRCPIHRRRDCCGREELPRFVPKKAGKWEQVRIGISRIRDEHARHPDGYRYRLSKSEMDKVLIKKVDEQKGECSICFEPLTDMGDVVPDHKEPRGMNGGWRDDRAENIGAAHSICNLEKGSQRT